MSEPARPKVVVLASGAGSLAQAIFDAAARDGDFEVRSLITDKPSAAVVQRATSAGIDVATLPVGDYPSREEWDREFADTLSDLVPDLIVSAGFMRVLGPAVLERFEGRIINSHPSLLPRFPGAHAVRDALAAGVAETGTTVHMVDSGVDTGPVLAQIPVPVLDGDTEDTLHERIKEHERLLIVQVLRRQLGLAGNPRL